MMKQKHHRLFNLIMTIAGVLTVVCLSVSIVLWLTPLYRLAAIYLDLPEKTGLSLPVIIRNYRTLIHYNMLWVKEALVFPDFKSSPSGLVHFQDVKKLFGTIQLLGLGGVPFCFIGWKAGQKMKAFGWMKWTAVITLSACAGLAAGAAINATATFVFLHRILFTNAFWAFDAAKDPVIQILPGEVFLAAAIETGVFILIGDVILAVKYRLCVKKPEKRSIHG